MIADEDTRYRIRYEYGPPTWEVTDEVVESLDEALELLDDALDDPLFVMSAYGQAVTVDRLRGGRVTRVTRWELVEGRWIRRKRR